MRPYAAEEINKNGANLENFEVCGRGWYAPNHSKTLNNNSNHIVIEPQNIDGIINRSKSLSRKVRDYGYNRDLKVNASPGKLNYREGVKTEFSNQKLNLYSKLMRKKLEESQKLKIEEMSGRFTSDLGDSQPNFFKLRKRKRNA